MPDLHGDPLGVVRREVAHPAIRPRPQGRHGDGHPGAGTGDELPGVPQNGEDLDRRADDGAHRRLSPTHAIGPLRTVRRLWVSRLRRRRQPSRTAPHRIQRGGGFRPPKRGGRRDRSRNRGASRGDGAFPGGPRPARPREEDQQPADVADDDVPCRDRVALGLAARPVRQQRARPPAANDRGAFRPRRWSPPTRGSSGTRRGRRSWRADDIS